MSGTCPAGLSGLSTAGPTPHPERHYGRPADPHRPLDPVCRFRAARRGNSRHRGGGSGLHPCRRDGRPFRAQHHAGAGDRAVAASADQKGARLSPDDRAGRSLYCGLRQGRRRHHYGARRGGAAPAPLAAGDPGGGQEGGRCDQSGDTGFDARARYRRRRSGAGDERQSRVWRAELHPGVADQAGAGQGADRWPADRSRSRWRDQSRDGGRGRRAPAPMCWLPAVRSFRATMPKPTRRGSRRSAMPPPRSRSKR